jgi:hypothetical protein
MFTFDSFQSIDLNNKTNIHHSKLSTVDCFPSNCSTDFFKSNPKVKPFSLEKERPFTSKFRNQIRSFNKGETNLSIHTYTTTQTKSKEQKKIHVHLHSLITKPDSKFCY